MKISNNNTIGEHNLKFCEPKTYHFVRIEGRKHDFQGEKSLGHYGMVLHLKPHYGHHSDMTIT